jgi:hypothetical protein
LSTTGDRLRETLLGWIPAWVGFVFIIVAGVVMIIMGVVMSSPGLVAFGVATVASAVLAWMAGGTSTPRADPIGKSFGGAVKGIDGWVWLVIFALFLVAAIIAIVT